MTLRERLEGRRFGLVLSAGFFGFYGHAGFLRGLVEAGLSPHAYAGTSAGGLVAAFAASGLEPERIEKLMLEQRREHFWDPDLLGAVVGAVRGNHAATGLLSGRRFRALLERWLPARTFEECERPLVLVATDLTHGEPAVFTSGELAPRVHATCAYPGLFRAVDLDGKLYWDGGLVDKAPALALADSPAGRELDALLVHYLPSRERARGGLAAYAQALGVGMAALRREHFRLQLEVLRSRGLAVYVVESELPPLSPTRMHEGRRAADVARQRVLQALAERASPTGLFSGRTGGAPP